MGGAKEEWLVWGAQKEVAVEHASGGQIEWDRWDQNDWVLWIWGSVQKDNGRSRGTERDREGSDTWGAVTSSQRIKEGLSYNIKNI